MHRRTFQLHMQKQRPSLGFEPRTTSIVVEPGIDLVERAYTQRKKPSSTRVANKQKLDLRALELRDIISTVYAYHGNNFELAVQEDAELVLFLFTAGRDSPLLATKAHPDEFLGCTRVFFYPQRDPTNKTTGSIVTPVITSWKGFNKGKRLMITFTIRRTAL
ncbi:uncharacterized protein EHS24_005099 [Apiotrichum porosum]|uniref:Uncharacterized protein n=1 Tax=Apiotrichum porosum TaxID=105984 RepID=A0A427Y6W7_9TREE|nr:uncharacterized protein EHS24_005099 [Apiotrichum porosum]RSH86825.1 hypothetical protein EHS24_005099 [Apiotrichum porosum]